MQFIEPEEKSEQPEIGPSFFTRHHFETSDGRFWTTIACAAAAAVYDDLKRRLTAIDRRTGRAYTHEELVPYAVRRS